VVLLRPNYVKDSLLVDIASSKKNSTFLPRTFSKIIVKTTYIPKFWSIILDTVSQSIMPIVFSPEGMIEEVKKNPCSTLDKEICAAHIVKVWEAVSEYVIEQLCKGRGVKIPRLAVINFKVKTVEMSPKEVIVQKIPHILLSSQIELRHKLKVKRPVYNLDVPEVDLNLSAIAFRTCLIRSHVELCIEEVICAFNRALMCDPQVEFWFPKIGRVVIQCADVDVVFCTEFLDLLGYSDEFIQDKACPLRPALC